MISVEREELPSYTAAERASWEGDWELIGGIPYAMAPSPLFRHQALATRLAAAMVAALDHCPDCTVVAECDWHVDERTVLRPDLSVVCRPEADFIRDAPEIVVEVWSPATIDRDLGLKRKLCEQAGVLHYLIVDPERLELLDFRRREDTFAEPRRLPTGDLDFANVTCPFAIDLDRVFAPFRA